MVPYMDVGEERASGNEEMTNHCRSTEAVSPMPREIPTHVLLRGVTKAAGIQVTLQTPAPADVQERRRRCSLAVEMIIRALIQSLCS